MPDITKQENDLLHALTGDKVSIMGKPRMKQVATFIHRLMYLVDEAAEAKRKAEVQAHGLWLTASGKLTEDDINANLGLSDEHRADLLKLVQLRHDADHWREHTGFDLPDLPSVIEPANDGFVIGSNYNFNNPDDVKVAIHNIEAGYTVSFEGLAQALSLKEKYELLQPLSNNLQIKLTTSTPRSDE
jgi:hypothetical protein